MTPSLVAAVPAVAALFAASERVQHRITSGLVEGFSQWWQMPALVLAVAALGAFVLWMYRRDAVELPRGIGIVLAALRLGAIAALVAAYLDLERRAEHEIVFLIAPTRAIAEASPYYEAFAKNDREVRQIDEQHAMPCHAARCDAAVAMLCAAAAQCCL
jgi:hypothetical protein